MIIENNSLDSAENVMYRSIDPIRSDPNRFGSVSKKWEVGSVATLFLIVSSCSRSSFSSIIGASFLSSSFLRETRLVAFVFFGARRIPGLIALIGGVLGIDILRASVALDL